MALDDYFDRKKIEVFTIKPEIKAMSRKERLELLNRLFMEEYQGKFVTYEMLERDLFVETSGRTRKHFSYKGPGTTHKEHQAKINICASGGYWDMISDATYYGSKRENKSGQNHFHKNTEAWHYFTKDIMCEDHYFRVVIDVNESKDHAFLIYSVALHSLGKEYSLAMQKDAERAARKERERGKGKKDQATQKEKDNCGSNNKKAAIAAAAQESEQGINVQDPCLTGAKEDGADGLRDSGGKCIYSSRIIEDNEDVVRAELGVKETLVQEKEKELIIPGHEDTGLCDELFTGNIIAEKHSDVNRKGSESLENLIGAAKKIGNAPRARNKDIGYKKGKGSERE